MPERQHLKHAICRSSWHSGLNTIIGHSTCWADGQMALAGLGSTTGLTECFGALISLAGML